MWTPASNNHNRAVGKNSQDSHLRIPENHFLSLFFQRHGPLGKKTPPSQTFHLKTIW